MENALPKRKPTRLKDYDYSTPGAYFVTICTKNKELLFGPIEKDSASAPTMSPIGSESISARMIKRAFRETLSQYPHVECPIFVVMPNHFHAIIVISRADTGSAPTLSDILQNFKRRSTNAYIKLVKQGILPPFSGQIWQRGFYDHVIRNQADYDAIVEYIAENPLKWQLRTP